MTEPYSPRRSMGRTAPVVTAAGITSLATATVALLVAFGVPLSEAQEAAILGLVAVVGPLVVAYVGSRTTVEYVAGGEVVRGQANEGATGEVVREIGSLTDG